MNSVSSCPYDGGDEGCGGWEGVGGMQTGQ